MDLPASSTRPARVEYCPIEDLIGVIGGRWKPYILWCLLEKPMRTGELSRAIPGVTQKMLTQHLRELERDGLVSRTVFPEVPPHVEYRVTDLGLSLGEVLVTMCHWSHDHMEAVREARAGYDARPGTGKPANRSRGTST